MPTTPRRYLSLSAPGTGRSAAISACCGDSSTGVRGSSGPSPMSTRRTDPAYSRAGSIRCAGLWVPKVTVRSARIAGPRTSPVSASTPLGRSTATTAASPSATSSASRAAFGRRPPRPPMPTMPSTTRRARRSGGPASSGAAVVPPARRRAARPPGWTRSGDSRTAVTPAPRAASRAPAYRASPPLSPLPTRRTTRAPYTRPRSWAQAVASPAAARCMRVPSGSRSMSARSAVLTVSTLYAVRMAPSLPRVRPASRGVRSDWPVARGSRSIEGRVGRRGEG
nr:hypothetical protein [Streptomyces sp. MH191]